jgi:hypothetical protein
VQRIATGKLMCHHPCEEDDHLLPWFNWTCPMRFARSEGGLMRLSTYKSVFASGLGSGDRSRCTAQADMAHSPIRN